MTRAKTCYCLLISPGCLSSLLGQPEVKMTMLSMYPDVAWYAQYPKMVGNRKDDIGLWVAACDTYQDVHWVQSQMGTTAGILEFMSDSFKSQWHKNMSSSQVELIPCMPLSAILSKFGVHQIDFWSLDVEGGEMQVGLPLQYPSLGTAQNHPPPPPPPFHTSFPGKDPVLYR